MFIVDIEIISRARCIVTLTGVCFEQIELLERLLFIVGLNYCAIMCMYTCML